MAVKIGSSVDDEAVVCQERGRSTGSGRLIREEREDGGARYTEDFKLALCSE